MLSSLFILASKLSWHGSIRNIPNHIALTLLDRSVFDFIHCEELGSNRVRFPVIMVKLTLIKSWFLQSELILGSLWHICIIIL